MPQEKVVRKKLGEIVLEKGLVTQEQIKKALDAQTANNKRLGQILMEFGYLTEDQLSECLALQLGIPHIGIRFYTVEEAILELVSADLVKKYRFLPLDKIGTNLAIAISDELADAEVEEIEKSTGCHLKYYFITPSDFDYGFEVLYLRRQQEGKGTAGGSVA